MPASPSSKNQKPNQPKAPAQCAKANTGIVPGARVRLKKGVAKKCGITGRRPTARVLIMLSDVHDGVKVDTPLDGFFYCWNVADLELVGPKN